jgi:hypothetical protein
MIPRYRDLPDIVTFEEKVGPFLGLFNTVHNHSFCGPEPANYLFVNEVCYILCFVLL